MVETNILLEKINKIEAGFKDNILLKDIQTICRTVKFQLI